MERLKRSFSFRKKKDHVPESHKPHQWQEDERKVRDGTCSFQVRYLGCIEVFESRGIQVCEEAVKALKSKNSRSVWARMSMRRKKKNKENQEVDFDDPQCKGKYQRAILYVSGDALRVVDEISKGLIVDQTIEKVSFCAPDRNQEKGFAYICRDGTTRRWMCHGFLAMKETGERLSHAVGCAFAICLERKQKREKESVTVTFNDKGTSFTRTGSFRQTTLTERLQDPQSAIVAEPVPVMSSDNPHAVQRPHATADMLQRQYSFRGFQKLNESSPFKRQVSLRLNDLPSTLDRQKQFGNGLSNGGSTVATIPEASPTREREEASISEMCQALTQGLDSLSSGPEGATTDHDPFASAPNSAALLAKQQATADPPPSDPAAPPSHNPWGSPAFSGPAAGAGDGDITDGGKISDAEFWLNTATSLAKDPFTGTVTTASSNVTTTTVVNGSVQAPAMQPAVLPIQQTSPWAAPGPPSLAQPHPTPPSLAQRAPHLAQVRSHSVDTAEIWHNRDATTGPQFTPQAQAWPTPAANATANKQDPFDAAWAAKGKTNPFQTADPTVTKTFEVNL